MMAKLTAVDRVKAIEDRRVGQILVTHELLQGLLGLDGGDIIAVQQTESERLGGLFRIFIASKLLQPLGDEQIAPIMQLEDLWDTER